jgi:hypothetical protein
VKTCSVVGGNQPFRGSVVKPCSVVSGNQPFVGRMVSTYKKIQSQIARRRPAC